MELQRAASGASRVDLDLIEKFGEGSPPEAPPDPEDASQSLGSFWNWTVLLAKRPLIRCGRIFYRKGIRGPFKYVIHFLPSNCVEFIVELKLDADVSGFWPCGVVSYRVGQWVECLSSFSDR